MEDCGLGEEVIGNRFSRQNPSALARGEARRQQPIIDLPGYSETVEDRWRQEEACVVHGEMSVKTSLKARGLFGSVGSPGLGSSTRRTAPTVGKPQLAPVTVSCTWSFTPGNMVVKTLGSKPVVSSR